MNIVRPSCESNTTMPKRDLKSLLTEEEEKGEPTNTADVKKAKLVHSELAQRLHRLHTELKKRTSQFSAKALAASVEQDVSTVEVLVFVVRLLNKVDRTRAICVALTSLLSTIGVPDGVLVGSSLRSYAMTSKTLVLDRLARTLVHDSTFLRGLSTVSSKRLSIVLGYVESSLATFFRSSPQDAFALLRPGSHHLLPRPIDSTASPLTHDGSHSDISDISRKQFSGKWKRGAGEAPFPSEHVAALLALPWFTRRLLGAMTESITLGINQYQHASLSLGGWFEDIEVPVDGSIQCISDRVVLWSLGLKPTRRNEIMCCVDSDETLTMTMSVDGMTRLKIFACIDGNGNLNTTWSVGGSKHDALYSYSAMYERC